MYKTKIEVLNTKYLKLITDSIEKEQEDQKINKKVVKQIESEVSIFNKKLVSLPVCLESK
jgi:hypothetical protein